MRIVAESYGEGTTVSATARRHALTVPQLFAWRRTLGERRQEAVPLRFVPVSVAEAGRGEGPAGGSLEITIALGGAVVRVPCGADGATLHAVVQALRAVP